MGADATVYEQLDPAMTTKFVGYDELTCEGEITAMTTETEVVSALNKGDKERSSLTRQYSMLQVVVRKRIKE